MTVRSISSLLLLTPFFIGSIAAAPANGETVELPPAAPSTNSESPAEKGATPTGQNIIFIHPDGAGLSGWNIHRILRHGPDGHSHWDLLPRLAVYRSHMRDNLDASSHGGGTIHAYGVKVLRDSFGMNGKKPLKSASGYPGSVMMEARDAGLSVAIINSGHLAEPGTACMLASVESRAMREAVAAQLIESGADLIFGGGEVLFLPEGTKGVHGQKGLRTDGRNLVDEAKKAGYRVIYRKADLATLSSDTPKILGLFAAENTYNDLDEETLEARGLPHYDPTAPEVAEMTAAALRWLTARGRPYFLMVEEEGTDNFANAMNAAGTMEAFRRADDAIAVARKQVVAYPDSTTLLVASDSEASCPALIPFGTQSSQPKGEKLRRLPGTTAVGAPLDGSAGTGTVPFVTQPDRVGQRHLFGIAWIDGGDHFGGVLARAEGARADRLPINLDNTGIYHFLREVLLKDD